MTAASKKQTSKKKVARKQPAKKKRSIKFNNFLGAIASPRPTVRVGRPIRYNDSMAETAYNITLLGGTLENVADAIDRSLTFVKTRMHDNEEFREAIMQGREIADAKVARSLYERAVGYDYVETKLFCHEGVVIEHQVIRHVMPDTAAGMNWLANRQRGRWFKEAPPRDAGAEEALAKLLVALAGRLPD